MPNINLSFTTSAFVVALLVLIAIAISAYFYRHTVPPIPRGKKILLIALRSVALALLLMFLFEPLLRLISTSTQKPVLAVLVDVSKSMGITDKTGDRAAQLRSILASSELKNGIANSETRFYTFGTRTNANEAFIPESLKLADDATDITAALRKLAEEIERLNIGSAVLISDGAYNLGQNPIYEAEQLQLPLYAIGIGDSTEQKDVLITKVVTNELVYPETGVPVDVTLKSSGYKGEKVEVVLMEGTKELARSQVVLEEGTREYAVRLSYIPEGEGVKKYSVRVSRLAGELTTANNQRTFLARTLKSKLRVLIIAGAPSPDLTIIRQTLSEDKNISIRSFAQKSGSSFYEGSLTTQTLDSSDCIVLVGFPHATSSDAVVEMIRAAIVKKNIAVLFVYAKTIDERKLSAFSSLLPFSSANVSTNEQLVFIEPSGAQRNHPIFATNTEEGVESWKRLPPIYKTQTTFRAKAEATVLATTKINNIVLNDPLIVIRNVNKQKSLAILGYGIWRWRLMAQGSPQSERLFVMFLGNSIRWLTTSDENRPVKVSPVKSAFTQGEPIEFIGQVYDANANPIENAQLTLTAQQLGREFQTTLRALGNGRYEGTLEGLSEGDYTFKATATMDGQPVGEDRGRFSIGELALEFQDTRMNAQLLRQLAARTGGEFFTPTTFSGLGNQLTNNASFVPREVQQAREFELWNWKYMLALVVLLFAIEWFVRKRSGML